MSNGYKGWGGEDDDLFRRLFFRGLIDCDTVPHQPHRPPIGNGVFLTISEDGKYHTRGKSSATNNPYRILDLYDFDGIDLAEKDGLSYVHYTVTSRQTSMLEGFTEVHHIKVVPDYEQSLVDLDAILEIRHGQIRYLWPRFGKTQ